MQNDHPFGFSLDKIARAGRLLRLRTSPRRKAMLRRAVTLVESRAEESPWSAAAGVRAPVSDPFHSVG
jgi:hypothetical protein